MSGQQDLSVYSEIGKLRRVLLHRPGTELDNMTPESMGRLLFDDLPDPQIAAAEHDAFAEILRDNGVEILYLEDLIAEVLADLHVRDHFLDEFLAEGRILMDKAVFVKDYFMNMADTKGMVRQLISGLRKENYPEMRFPLEYVDSEYPMVIDPLPNMYFTRDPFTVIGNAVSINSMYSRARRREPLFGEYIFTHHPMFKHATKRLYSHHSSPFLEGGDILILSEDVIAIGISERTETMAIETLAKNIFTSDTHFKHILAFKIPSKRAFMHLDTVFTMIDRDVFTIHPDVEGVLVMYDITWDGQLQVKELEGRLEDVLKCFLHLDAIKLVRCGGGSAIDAQREQWNDASNTLAIAPGVVVVYGRNHVTNRLLEEAGVILHKIPSSEISRGRGGPRCMSMPLNRDPL